MKTIQHIYTHCQELQMQYEEERRLAILREEDRKRMNREFASKLIKPRK